jgi:hypothetical protein
MFCVPLVTTTQILKGTPDLVKAILASNLQGFKTFLDADVVDTQ